MMLKHSLIPLFPTKKLPKNQTDSKVYEDEKSVCSLIKEHIK